MRAQIILLLTLLAFGCASTRGPAELKAIADDVWTRRVEDALSQEFPTSRVGQAFSKLNLSRADLDPIIPTLGAPKLVGRETSCSRHSLANGSLYASERKEKL
jgi:hypothetical protein